VNKQLRKSEVISIRFRLEMVSKAEVPYKHQRSESWLGTMGTREDGSGKARLFV
jgi:hypothetical protein